MALDPGSIGAPIDERYPSDLAVRSIEFLEAALPSFVARPASIETVLTEANAQAVAEVVNVANQTVGAVEEDMLARFFGVPRLPGAAAVGEVTLTFDGTVSQTIPAGVRLALPEVGLEIVTTADVVVSGASSAVVQVATAVPSSLANGVGVGAVVDVLDVVPRLLSVALTLGMSGGANPESDAEFIVRASARCARITNSLVVPEHFSAFVLEDGRASNATAIRAWGSTSTVTAGSDAGYVTVVTYGRGDNLSPEVRAELESAMQAITAAGVTVYVKPAIVSTVNVTVTVAGRPGYASADVSAAVETAVRAFLSPESWPIGEDVLPLALAGEIAKVGSVDFVSSLAAPASTVTVPIDGVVTAGTVSVTVT